MLFLVGRPFKRAFCRFYEEYVSDCLGRGG